MSQFLVAPSILSADFSKLGEEVQAVLSAGADWVHVDVMDGHFVPNLTIGAPVVKSLRPTTSAILDVHLMIENPEKYVPDFIKAGADYITIHIEATGNAKDLIQKIQSAGVKAGITLRPGTPLSEIEEVLPLVDLVLVMTVEPGFGGQSFMQDQVEKINDLAKWRKAHQGKYLIEVDGGVNETTAKQCLAADVLVAGSFIFKAQEYQKPISALKALK